MNIDQHFASYRIKKHIQLGNHVAQMDRDTTATNRQILTKSRQVTAASDRVRLSAALERQLSHPHISRRSTINYQSDNAPGCNVPDSLSLFVFLDPIQTRQRIHRTENTLHALAIVEQLTEALQQAHNLRITHGNITSRHVVFKDQLLNHVLLTGFRGVRSISASDIVERNEAQGTLAFLAPEQLAGGAAEERTDLYALGVILYEMVTGRKPFMGNTANVLTRSYTNSSARSTRDFNQHLSANVEAFILKAIASDPDQRFQTAGHMQAALRQLHIFSPISTGTATPTHSIFTS